MFDPFLTLWTERVNNLKFMFYFLSRAPVNVYDEALCDKPLTISNRILGKLEHSIFIKVIIIKKYLFFH